MTNMNSIENQEHELKIFNSKMCVTKYKICHPKVKSRTMNCNLDFKISVFNGIK